MIEIHISRENGGKKYVYLRGNEAVNIIQYPNGTSFSSTFQENCPHCGEIECYLDCEDSQEALNGDQDAAEDQREEAAERQRYNLKMEGIERLVMALASEGIDMGDLRIAEAIFTAADGASNNV